MCPSGVRQASAVDCFLGETPALPSAPSSLSAPSALLGLSVVGVLLAGAMGLDAAYREDLMVRTMLNLWF